MCKTHIIIKVIKNLLLLFLLISLKTIYIVIIVLFFYDKVFYYQIRFLYINAWDILFKNLLHKKLLLIFNVKIFIYFLAASVLRMLFNTWEVKKIPETYKLVLRHYLNKQRNGTARPTDLWESFEKFVSVEEASIEEIMDTWTNQPGYPVVNAILNNNVLTLTQVISYSFILCRYIFIFGLKIL